MKKTLLILTILLFSWKLFSQVQLEHTYAFSGTLTQLDENEYKYFVMDVPLKQCRIFNEDHSLFKTINLSVPSGYYLYDIKFVTRKLFNDDDLVELLYIYSKSETVNNEEVYSYGLKVVNEQGSVLMSLSDGGYAEVKEGSDGKKLLAYQYIYYDYYYLVYTNIYSLGGSGPVKSADFTGASSLNLYPNPVNETLNIQYDPLLDSKNSAVMISDLQGKVLKRQPVPAGVNFTTVETAGLRQGTYIISVTENENILRSEKFEKID